MDIHGHCSDSRDGNRTPRLMARLARVLRGGFLASCLLLFASSALAQGYPDPLANTATVTAPTTAVDPDTTNNNATDTNALAASAGLSLVKTLLTASPAPANSTVQYQLVVANAGPSAAVGATITDTVPAELTNVSWTCTASAGSSCASPLGTGNAISLLADIAPSGNVTLTISGTAPASGTIGANTATVTPPTGTTDPDPTDNTDTVPPIPVAGVANLGVVKTLLTASPAPAGSTVQYDVVVTNAGPSAAVGALLADTVPAELTNVTWTCTASAGSTCTTGSGTGNAISVQANIAAGGTITLLVSGTAPASGTIGANTATATNPPGTTDPDPTDNTDTVPPIPVTPLPTVSIDSPSTTEGSPMVFTVSLSGTSATDVSVTLTTSDGTANAPADYTATTTTVTIPAGQTSATVSVPTVADGIYEGNETFNATLSNPVGATLGTAAGVGTILDANAAPTLSINDVSVAENAGTATFTVSLSGPSALPVTVSYATADGTAVSPADFASTSGTLTFAPGVTTQPVAVSIVNDAIAEGSESFTVNLSNPTVATIADGSGLGTIVDDESGLLVSVDSPSTTEGSPMVFTVSLSGTSASPVTVTLTTSDGTANAPADYTATTTTVTIPAGQTSATVSVPTAADGIYEGNETFNATLSNPTGATLGTAAGVGTIIDANAVPTLSINDVSVAENAGTATFTVSLSGPSALPVTVAYATADGTATSPADFASTSGTLTFAPGVTTQPVAVSIVNDAIAEGSESFTVNLSNPTVATIADGSGLGTIVDDESGLLVSVDSPSTTEGSPMVFTVSLSGTSASPVTVSLTTSDGTANAPADYTATTTTVTIPAGQTSATVSVPTAADGIYEGNETFNATLSNPVGATLGTAAGVGTIIDANAVPTLSINDVSVAENAGTATFAVSLSGPSALPVTVSYATADGTATSPADFGATSGTLTFAPGVTTQPVAVGIVNDAIAEGNESFTVNLSNPTVATIADGSGLGTIVDDESGLLVSVDSPSTTEGSPMVFTVSLSGTSASPVTVTLTTSDGTANAPADYTATTTTVTIPAGQTSATVSVPTVADGIYEGNETFNATLSNPTGATLGTATGVGTIIDATPAPALTINDVSVSENAGTATFTVSLSGPSALPVTVAYATADGTATSPADFGATSGTLTFAPGVTTQPVAVSIVNDAIAEGSESFTVNLSNPTVATIADGSGLGTIVDDESGLLVSVDSPSTTEGSPMVFTVSLSGTSATDVSVTLATSDGTANAPADYTATTTTVTIPAGQTSATVSVPTVADGLYEGNETFNATLSNPVGATLGTAAGVGTILDANAAPTLSINDVSVAENAGTATFTVSLSGPSALPVTVSYATADGTAVSPADFASTSGTLTFAPGVTTQPVAVSIVNDAIAEGSESFTVNLSNPTVATIADGSGLGTIVDDESGLLVSVDSPSTTEGSPMVFTVSLSGTSATDVSVTLATSDGTANAPADYTATTTTVTIPAGQTSATVSVPTAADGIYEGNETFNATLSNPTGATLGTAAGVGTILDANAVPTLSINDISVAENAGTATFTVSLSGPSALPVTVAYATADGTATSPADFASTSGTLTFAPGVTTQPVAVSIVNDAIAEGSESFTVNLSNPTVATIADGAGLGTIVDDESGLLVSIDSPSTTEGSPMVFTVSLSGTSASPVTVTLTTSDGTANAPADYTATTTTVTIPAGQTSATVSVPTVADGIYEGNETFNATLSNPTGATLGTATGTGTILDANAVPTLSINDVSVAENAGTATFTVSLSGPSALPVTVSYATADGTAVSPADFGATSGTLTFAPGVTTQPVAVSIVNDAIAEGSESFTVNLSNPTVATIADGSGLGTIVDDESGLLVSVDSPSTTEGSPMVFTVSLSGTSASPVTVTLTTSDGTANAPADYTATTTTVTIPAGQTSATVSVPTAADGIYEGNETFNATLSNPTGATLGTATGTGTILDANAVPTLSINDVSVAENAGTATFTVSLSGPSALPVTVAYATADGTATSPADFGATSGTLTFAPGVTTQPVAVSIVNDAIAEGTESFTVNLSNPTVATIADGSGLGTILDGQQIADLGIEKTLLTASPAPAGSTVTYRLVVTNAGPTVATGATITDTVPSELANVTWTCVASGTSSCGTASGSGNVNLAATVGVGAANAITITVSGTAPASGTIGANTATVSPPPGTSDPDPTDDTDTVPEIPVDGGADLSVDKTLLTASPAPANSAVQYQVVVSNAGPSAAIGATVTDSVPAELTNVTWTCTASAGSSCATSSGTGNAISVQANIAAGGTITLLVSGTAPASGTIGANTAVAIVPPGTTDPDPTGNTDTVPEIPVLPVAPLPTVSIDSPSATEGQPAIWTISLSAASATPVIVGFATSDGTATAPADYTATAMTLTIAAGQTNVTVNVPTVADTLFEGNETFNAMLSNPVGATLGVASGVATILDDDLAPAQLRLTKQATTREVRVGDLVRYTVSIQNVGTVDAVDAVLVDTPPAGFTYVDGSLLVDDEDDSALVVGTNPIRIEGIDVFAGGRGTVVYYLRVGAGVGPGIFANYVIATDDDGDTISNEASAEVEVAGDPLLDESLILGSVFDDRNGNGLQDMGERGVPGVRIASVEGLVMETDAHGRYHLVGIPVDNKARGRNFILKVDAATLPPGTTFTTPNPLVRRITAGLPVRFDFGVRLPDGQMGGGQSRVDIELAELLFAPGSADLNAEHASTIDRIAGTVREYGGGRLTVTATGDGEVLALRRAQVVQAALLERLDPALRARTSVAVVSWVEPSQPLVSLGENVALGHLLFDTDSDAIRPEYQALIRELAATIDRQNGGTLEVHGHADRRASDDYNMKLGMRRAKAVADAIAARLSPEARARLRVEAIDPSRVATTGQR